MAFGNTNIKQNVIMKLNNKYFLLRHGQTIYQKEGREENYPPNSGDSLSITKEGQEMVKESAQKLKERNINLIFASPFLRTKQSAEITVEILGINKEKINYDERLIDINLGEFMGKSFKESHAFYLGDSIAFDNRPKGGESWYDILKRVKLFLDELEKKYKNKNILVISHADPIWLMVGYLRGYTEEKQFLEARNNRRNSYPSVAQLIEI